MSDPSCNKERKILGLAYPRTCARCGLFGPCRSASLAAATIDTPLSRETRRAQEAVNANALLRMELEEAATDLAAARQTILRMEQKADALRKERDEDIKALHETFAKPIAVLQARVEAAEAMLPASPLGGKSDG